MKIESEINQCLDRILADDKYYADEYRDGFRCALGWVLGEMHNTLFEEPDKCVGKNKSCKTKLDLGIESLPNRLVLKNP